MAEIRKRCWPEIFEKVMKGEKNFDIRLANFEINKGDTLVLQEFDPNTGYTGKEIQKCVANVTKLQLLDFHNVEEIRKFGHMIIEMR